MTDLTQKWAQVADLLRDAANALPSNNANTSAKLPVGPLGGTHVEFETFLAHNELELAWDALAALAARLKAGASVWLLLARAATLMGLKSHANKASRMVVKSMPFEEPRYRLIYQRRYRTRTGKLVWRRPTSAVKSHLEAV